MEGYNSNHDSWNCTSWIILFSDEYRLSRVTAFLHPEEDIRGTNWQAAQSLYALGSGEIFGLGLGQSRQNIYGFQKLKMTLYFLY